MKKFVTKSIFKKIQAHIVTKLFVTKTISDKNFAIFSDEIFVTEKFFCCHICDEKIRH